MSFDLDDEEPTTLEPNDWLRNALSNARERRKVRYAEEKNGYNWLLECRDMGDAYDAVAGVFYIACKTRKEVDGKAGEKAYEEKIM